MHHIDLPLHKIFGFSGDPCVVKSFLDCNTVVSEETSYIFMEPTISRHFYLEDGGSVFLPIQNSMKDCTLLQNHC
jgi:hypothetical protein